MNIKNIPLVIFAVVVIYGTLSFNSSYSNCMDATKHSYISEKGAKHIAAQCQSFIKDKSMIK